MNNKQVYIITLKNGKTKTIWFLGNQLEEILKDYNIPYKKVKK